MATDVERLIVALEARTTAFERALRQANGSANRQARSIERRFQQMNRNLSTGFAGLGTSITKAFAVAGGIRGMQTLLDSATRIENALKVAGHSGEDLRKVYDQLFASAQRNAVPMESLVTLYSRVAAAASTIGATQEEVVQFTDKVALSLRVSGQSATETAGALLQLSQAIGNGVVQSEEYNSLLDGARPLLQAVAAGLKEAGGDVSALTRLVKDGKVSSEAFFRAFEAGSVTLEEKVKGSTLTTSQGFTLLANALVKATGEFANGSMAADSLGAAFSAMADKINSVDFNRFGEQARELVALVNQVRDAIGWLASAGANIGAALGTDALGDWATGGAAHGSYLGGALTITNQRGVQRRIDEAFGQAVETAGALTEAAIREAAGTVTGQGKTGRLSPSSSAVTPVSLDDYASPSAKGGKGGGRSAKERADDYERLSQRISESTAALVAETEVQRQLNPLVDDYGYAVERARTEQELMNAALSAGKEITPELRDQISALAEQYAMATVEAAKLAESQDRVRESAQEMLDLQKDTLRGIVDGFMEGKKAADVFADALSRVANKLLDMAFNNLFDPKRGGSGGILGGAIIPGILHSGGVAGRDGYGHGRSVSPSVFSGAKRYHKGGVAGLQPGEVPAILQRGEVVLPRGMKAGQGAPVVVNFSPHIDNRGASVEAVARNERQLEQLKRDLPGIVTQTVRKAQKSNVKLG